MLPEKKLISLLVPKIVKAFEIKQGCWLQLVTGDVIAFVQQTIDFTKVYYMVEAKALTEEILQSLITTIHWFWVNNDV